MTPPPEPEDSMSLVMPFVACASQGGSYDDDAYVAGYEAGQIDSLLAANDSEISHVVHVVIHSGNEAQADLIAMRHGYTMTTEASADPQLSGWLHAAFVKAANVVAP